MHWSSCAINCWKVSESWIIHEYFLPNSFKYLNQFNMVPRVGVTSALARFLWFPKYILMLRVTRPITQFIHFYIKSHMFLECTAKRQLSLLILQWLCLLPYFLLKDTVLKIMNSGHHIQLNLIIETTLRTQGYWSLYRN